MTVARYGLTATLLGNGTVLVQGGALDGSTTSESLNPTATQWTAGCAPTVYRWGAAAALLADGDALVASGTSTNYTPTVTQAPLASAELYLPATKRGSCPEGTTESVGPPRARAAAPPDTRSGLVPHQATFARIEIARVSSLSVCRYRKAT